MVCSKSPLSGFINHCQEILVATEYLSQHVAWKLSLQHTHQSSTVDWSQLKFLEGIDHANRLFFIFLAATAYLEPY